MSDVITYTLRIPADLKLLIDSRAKSNGRSLNQQIITMLRDMIEGKQELSGSSDLKINDAESISRKVDALRELLSSDAYAENLVRSGLAGLSKK